MRVFLCFVGVLASNAFDDMKVTTAATDRPLFPVDSEAALLLLQSHANISRSMPAGSKWSPMKDAPSDPELYSAMSNHMVALEETMNMVQRTYADKIKTLRALYEKNLTAQEEEIRFIGHANEQISAAIVNGEKKTEAPRQKAANLIKQIGDMVEDVQALQGALDSQRDLAANALERSRESLFSAPEMKVLDDLARLDAERKQNSEGGIQQTRNRKEQISVLQLEGPKLSALQLDGPTIAESGNGGLMNLVKGALDEMAQDQDASEALVKDHFDKQYEVGDARRTQLLLKQKELAKAKGAVDGLNGRLESAVGHLEKVLAQLKEQAQSLRFFSKRLSMLPMPEHKEQSFVQGQTRGSSLLHMRDGLRQPSRTLDAMNSRPHEPLENIGGSE